MNIHVVLEEAQFVVDNTSSSLQRVKQLVEGFAAYAEGEKNALALLRLLSTRN